MSRLQAHQTQAAGDVPLRVRSAMSRAALSVGLTLVLCTVAPVLVGGDAFVVMSGSMTPTLRPGDVVATRPLGAAAVRDGDVIVFDDPGRPGRVLIHRVVRHNADGSLVTQGDANTSTDSRPVARSAVRGLPVLRVAALGIPVLWRRERHYPQLALLLLALFLVVHRPLTPRAERLSQTSL